ncbi:MAG: Asp-tRNA(Asn)/Glu-tRNA(Gln) amidotransferase subunit GatC [Puniceicoccales bacterium]|jgi:aspartyl-tRNA(Asn)/glutamyl-tRNA(Gln) amidotransferase subunit C|nr:Asp-tRNA(Asn)/Glu-tRNA(Gln) amidotransferase subunit GatC [Puniceicoccales bacterium]
MTKEHIDIDHIAALCRIALTDEERKTFSQQLDTMIAYLDQLKTVDIGDCEPMVQALDLHNVLRADEGEVSFPVEVALMNAPEKKNNQILVPRIVE